MFEQTDPSLVTQRCVGQGGVARGRRGWIYKRWNSFKSTFINLTIGILGNDRFFFQGERERKRERGWVVGCLTLGGGRGGVDEGGGRGQVFEVGSYRDWRREREVVFCI